MLKSLFSVKWDFLLFIPFFCGLLLYMFRRASMSVKSSINNVSTIGHYFSANWAMLGARMPFVLPWYGVLQHANSLAVYFGHPIPFTIPNGAIACVMTGYMSNTLTDWATQFNIPFIPNGLMNALRDQVPLFPVNGDSVKTDVTADASPVSKPVSTNGR
jgi:hypothetical protein